LGVGSRLLSTTPIRNSANNMMSDFIGSCFWRTVFVSRFPK
jgi:hypothetical protein